MLPTPTFPKLKLEALAPSKVVVATPVPDSGIASGELGALLTTFTDPETAPPEAGPKTTLKVVFPPAGIVIGIASPLRLNPAPEMLACVIVRADEPVFDNRIVWELGDPTVTFPKATEDGVADIPA